jgi:hypothetical protein
LVRERGEDLERDRRARNQNDRRRKHVAFRLLAAALRSLVDPDWLRARPKIRRFERKSKENPKKLAESASNRDDGIPLLSENDRKTEKEVETTDSSVTFKRVQQLRNTRDAYIITVACLLVFGFLILLQDNIDIQVITFVLHTVIRTLIHSSAAGLYVQVFHMAHIGKLTGLGSIAGGTFSFIMIPFEKLVTNVLNGNPYLLNVGLLLASIGGGFLPIYLHFYAKKTEKELREIEEENSKLAKNNN